MEHIGIDLGSKKSHFCVRDTSGEIIREGSVVTQELELFFESIDPSHIILETCTESFDVADIALVRGHTVHVVPASVVRQLGVGYRKLKNDRRDAQVLSRASVALGETLPTVHIPSPEAREAQRIQALRKNLVHSRTSTINALKSMLRSHRLQLRSGSSTTVHERVRTLLSEERHSALVKIVEPMLSSLQGLNTAIAAYDTMIRQANQKNSDIKRAKTVPGVGDLVASAFVHAVDTPKRFKDASHLASYFGLTPGENSTGGRQRMTGITRAGKSQVRTLLLQAAWTHVRVASNSPLTQQFFKLEKGRPKQVAITAVARKLCLVLFAMWRDQRNFEYPEEVIAA